MGKYFRTTIAILLIIAMFCGCGSSGSGSSGGSGGSGTSVTPGNSGNTARNGVLRVFNATEYMDMTTIEDFEKEYNITVIYEEFESNEEMYDIVSEDPGAYDVLIPSDYSIDRLIKEGMLYKLDMEKLPNISQVAPEYLHPEYDPNNEYVVPYMVGTVGILYNKRAVSAPIDSWESMWDPQYRGMILMWDSMRDVVGVSLKMLGYSMNSGNDAELDQVEARLLQQRSIIKGYAGDIIHDIMVADEGTLALVYSGDAKTAVDQNPSLAYVIPKEGSNKWVDGFVITKDAQNIDAAHLFIDFMCRPNIAIRNMTDTGYTSPVFRAWDEFGGNAIMFPTDEELARCEAFMYNAQATQKYEQIWAQIRGS